MAENKDKEIIKTYEYYCNIIDIMLSDMSNVKLKDIQDAMDELRVELDKIEGKENEISAD